jgi:uncharacterized membrane protein (UPF0127 family)
MEVFALLPLNDVVFLPADSSIILQNEFNPANPSIPQVTGAPEVTEVTVEMAETALTVAWLLLVGLQEEEAMLLFRRKTRNYSFWWSVT